MRESLERCCVLYSRATSIIRYSLSNKGLNAYTCVLNDQCGIRLKRKVESGSHICRFSHINLANSERHEMELTNITHIIA